ncbi:hypothetical protein HMPREF3214_00855 [Alloscardovia omnicolens]|uniref:Uncharacterized protein n=1 Tax=Alloscardovia omnicolens F0580 TaxID=1321816 RepID=U1R7A9_9BIFI|nr:hypothetical protein HMPREF9244_01516 [Alloscardovia omnicolens F0580]KWZ74010.1 hypothetical protein HMPREF3214_00855 [Alloscardovia omnicolens]
MIPQGAWKLYISLLVHIIYIFVGLAFLLLAIAMFDIRLFSEIITRRTEDAQKRQYRRERIKKLLYSVLAFNCWSAFYYRWRYEHDR